MTNVRMHGAHHVGEGRGPDKEVNQRQARWLHALSCLIVLTGNRGELFGLVTTQARRLAGAVEGRMIKMAPGLFWLNADKLVSLQVCADLSLVSAVEGTPRFVQDSLGQAQTVESSCVYGAHAVSTSSWPLQTSCRPRAAAWAAPRRQSGVLAANSPSIAKRNPKEGPLERNEEVQANQSLLRPNQVLHKLVWVVHMMGKRQLPGLMQAKRRRSEASRSGSDRPSPTMTSALGTPSCNLSQVCGPCVKEGSNYGIQLARLE